MCPHHTPSHLPWSYPWPGRTITPPSIPSVNRQGRWKCHNLSLMLPASGPHPSVGKRHASKQSVESWNIFFHHIFFVFIHTIFSLFISSSSSSFPSLLILLLLLLFFLQRPERTRQKTHLACTRLTLVAWTHLFKGGKIASFSWLFFLFPGAKAVSNSSQAN